MKFGRLAVRAYLTPPPDPALPPSASPFPLCVPACGTCAGLAPPAALATQSERQRPRRGLGPGPSTPRVHPRTPHNRFFPGECGSPWLVLSLRPSSPYIAQKVTVLEIVHVNSTLTLNKRE